MHCTALLVSFDNAFGFTRASGPVGPWAPSPLSLAWLAGPRADASAAGGAQELAAHRLSVNP